MKEDKVFHSLTTRTRALIPKKDLEGFFKPSSIAVIGASATPGKIGHEILRNIKLSGYEGQVYPINPNSDSILGFKCYNNVSNVPAQIDLAIVVLPADLVEGIILECTKKSIPCAIIISSGFSEIGKKDLEDRILEIARNGHLRILGPNTFGIYYASSHMNATFGPNNVLGGKTAFITQSGALGLALMDWTAEEKYGVSSIVSIGNKSDVDDADLIEFFVNDPSTSSILIYMEGLKNGRKFFKISREASRRKPIVVIKAGRSKRGAIAASSHTGSIAGQDVIFGAAFEQAGVMRAEGMTQAFDWIQAINENHEPKGENIAIVTNGGGIGVLSTDKCEQLGLNLMELPDDLCNSLKEIIPVFGSIKNPIDLTANADDAMYGKVLEILLKHDSVDAVISIFCQTANIDPVLVAQTIINMSERLELQKPFSCAFIGGHLSQVAYTRMLEKKIAAYPTAERAVDSMYALIKRYRLLQGAR